MSRLIIVANRLPFSIRQTAEGLAYQVSPGGMAAALSPVQNKHQALWIGWHGLERPLIPEERHRLQLPNFARDIDIPAEVYQRYYYAVSNGVFWPAFHGFQPRSVFSEQDWRAYKSVNELFTTKIIETARPDDLIWIHDFHLLLLPDMLRQAKLKNRLGFFLHVPVADPSLLAKIPHWEDVLRTLAQLDLLGVQTKTDVVRLRQSFRAFSVQPPRILAFPVGIDVEPYRPAVAPTVNDKPIVVSISRLDYTKGILEQLKAVGTLRDERPDLDFVYRLVVSPSREGLAEYRELKQDIDALVKDINQRYPGTVDYHYETYGLKQMLATYRQADVLLVTPLIDGMNLIAKEYVVARGEPGVLIISRTIGAAQQLTTALHVEPANVAQIAEALAAALTMPATEKQQRWAELVRNVEDEDVFHWAATFLDTLQKTTRV